MKLASFTAIAKALDDAGVHYLVEYARALVKPLHGSVNVRFVTMATLIKMKQAAGRPHDLIDIENLKLRAE